MPTRILSTFLLLVAIGCTGKKESSGFNGKLTNQFLQGTWMVSDAEFTALKNAPYKLRDSLQTLFLMQVLRFDGSGNVLSDNADFVPEKGQYTATGKTLKLSFPPDKKMYYWLERAADSSMILVIEKSREPLFENGKIALKRINTGKYDIGKPDWKQMPAMPFGEKAIRRKLSDMLLYYRHFFEAMVSRNVDVLAHGKILMPIRYYSTGIAIRPFEQRKGWDVFFGDSTHAFTAYQMLQNAYDEISTFPVRENFFQLYADIFGMLEAKLEK
jgi:hypothetical protein